MRFMMLMIPTPAAEAGVLPDPAFFAAMMKYNEDLAKSGALLSLDGLQPSSKGARVRFSRGKTIVTDGPFTESKEVIGGYWIIQVGSKQEAVEWASRCPCAEGEVIEVRQIFDMEDFSQDIQEAVADTEPNVRAHVESRGQA
jgi:hypothetical protein